MADCSDLISLQDQKDAKVNADSINEFVNSDNPSMVTREGKKKTTIQGIDDLAEQQREQINNTFQAQFAYKRIGNISDYAGQQLQDADRLNSYQFPDDSGEWYVPIQSQTFPITIPADPAASGDWALVNALIGDWGSVTAGTEVKHRRGTAAEIAAFVPALAEIVFNTTDNTLHIGNGVISGGVKQTEEVNAKQFGAVGDGVTNDAPALRAAALHAVDTGRPLYIPAGEYLFDDSQRDCLFYGDIVIYGDGPGLTILKRADGNTVATPMLYTPDEAAPSNYIEIRNLTVLNRWARDGDFNTATNNTLSVVNCKRVVIDNVEVLYSGAGSIVTNDCDDVTVNNCVVKFSKRDGIRVINAVTKRITNNKLQDVLDDCIATPFTSDNSVGRIETTAIITGNTIVDSQGIIALGNKVAVITGNTLIRPMVRGIRCAADIQGEPFGATPTFGITVADNVIVDLFNGAVFNWANYADAIFVETFNPQAKDTIESYVTSAVQAPYGFLYTDDIEDADTPNAGAYNVSITNNKVIRTRPATGAYSSYGVGLRFTAEGYIDPQIDLTDMCENGINLGGTYRDTQVRHNILSGMATAVYLHGGGNAVTNTIRNVAIEDNIVSNVRSAGFTINGNGTLNAGGNIFDLDPYHENGNRLSDGTWDTGNTPLAISVQLTGITVLMDGCTYKNMKQISVPEGTIRAKNSVIFCDPLDGVGSIVKKGLGVIPNMRTHPGSTVIIEDNEPTSATFGKVKNVCLIATGALPTSGVYLQGYILNSRATDGNSTAWIRVITGDGHVLGTDWVAI